MSSKNNKDALLEQIAAKAYDTIVSVYPICSYSDEFYFFPQAILDGRDWSAWDDYSADRVADVAAILNGYERDLAALEKGSLSAAGQIDVELMQHVMKTLREQLTDIAPHKSQPTFHLTILAAGLAEALDSRDEEAWSSRVAGVPEFLRRAGQCLEDVPGIFLQLGLDMLNDLQRWVATLPGEKLPVDSLLSPLMEFKAVLQALVPIPGPWLHEELLDVLLRDHLQCGLGVNEIQPILQNELHEMEEVLATETARILPGKNWVDAEKQMPFVAAAGTDLRELYLMELEQMENHCRQHRLIPESLTGSALNVAPVPEYLSVVRASDAYAAIPGSPSKGGTFYVMEEDRNRNGLPGRTLEYRMTAAHEVWPGHHLLDSVRWGLERSLRRPVESPLFYEGWACLAEELMERTGYFNGPWDHFLLAKRRAERAARGLIDLGLQSGTMTNAEASELLLRVGYRREHADSVVLKYLLRPGYQVCYTLGLKQALALLEKFDTNGSGTFVKTVLSQGEIGFTRLENVLSQKESRSPQ